MNRPTDPEADLPVYEPDEEAAYSLEIAARITGVKTETILHYQEQGLIQSSSPLSLRSQWSSRKVA